MGIMGDLSEKLVLAQYCSYLWTNSLWDRIDEAKVDPSNITDVQCVGKFSLCPVSLLTKKLSAVH
jgi:hypothetical protein